MTLGSSSSLIVTDEGSSIDISFEHHSDYLRKYLFKIEASINGYQAAVTDQIIYESFGVVGSGVESE